MREIFGFIAATVFIALYGFCLYKGACDRFKLLDKIFVTNAKRRTTECNRQNK